MTEVLLLWIGTAWGAQVMLLAPGNEPRALLRYTATQPQTLTVSKTTASVFEVAGLPDPDPTRVVQATTWTLTPTPDRSIQLAVVLTAADLRATPKSKLPPLGQWIGMKGQLRFDDRGLPLGASWTGSAAKTPEEQSRLQGLRSAMEQVMLPLPSEPVGLGAVWTVERTLDTGVLQVQAVTTYRWVGGTAAAPELEAKLVAKGVPGQVEIGGGAFKGALQTLTSTGQHRVQLHLDRGAPLRIEGGTQTRAQLDGWKGFIPVKVGLQVSQENRLHAD